MPDLALVIGNKAYSSWSLRPWLLLRESKIPFQEILVPLYLPDSPRRIREHSPSGRVPVLIDGATRIWDSLAICEYLAERFPEARGWPEAPGARAVARSVCAEMHSGFAAVRTELPMNLRGRRAGVTPSPAARSEIDRILEIWRECRRQFGAGGPFLFGRFGIADAMYAPVVTRFATYGVELAGAERDYSDAVHCTPLSPGVDEGRAGGAPRDHGLRARHAGRLAAARSSETGEGMPNIRWLLALITAVHRALYRATGGRIGARAGSAHMLLLTTLGRRSGQRRVTPLLYVEDGGRFVVVASNAGDDRHPAWLLNLRKQPAVEIQIGARHIRFRPARRATPRASGSGRSSCLPTRTSATTAPERSDASPSSCSSPLRPSQRKCDPRHQNGARQRRSA